MRSGTVVTEEGKSAVMHEESRGVRTRKKPGWLEGFVTPKMGPRDGK